MPAVGFQQNHAAARLAGLLQQDGQRRPGEHRPARHVLRECGAAGGSERTSPPGGRCRRMDKLAQRGRQRRIKTPCVDLAQDERNALLQRDAGEPVRIGEDAIEHLLRRFPVEREERLSDGCRGDEPLHAYAARNLAILEGEHRGGARAKRHAADVKLRRLVFTHARPGANGCQVAARGDVYILEDAASALEHHGRLRRRFSRIGDV